MQNILIFQKLKFGLKLFYIFNFNNNLCRFELSGGVCNDKNLILGFEVVIRYLNLCDYEILSVFICITFFAS